MGLLPKDFRNEIIKLIDVTIEKKFDNCFPDQVKKHNQLPESDYYTKRQACAFLHISVSTLNNKLRNRTLTKYHFGGKVLIKKSELESILNNQ